MTKKLRTLAALLISQACAFSAFGQETETLTKSSTPVDILANGGWKARWEGQVKAIENGEKCRLFMIGDSITQGWEGAGKEIWGKRFDRYKPINFGISGDRTEHVLWRIRNAPGIDKLKPKVAVIMIGTNNTGHNQRDPADTADGIKTIVSDLRTLWPDTKILLLGVFPRGEKPDDKLREINDGVNEIIAKYDDGQNVHYLDISSAFLDKEGNLPKDIMPDLLHLSPKGYELWEKAMRVKLRELGL